MLRCSFLRRVRCALILLASALLVSSSFSATLTMDATERQPLSGWGIFPGYSHSNWGDPYRSVANRPAIRDKLFELAVNCVRVELCSNSYDAASADLLNLDAMNELKTHLLTAKGKGVAQWTLSLWSPPAPFKSPIQDTRGKVGETVTYMNMEFKDRFCQYLANALAWLRDNGCGSPVVISLQNEPNYPVPYDGCSYRDKADYQTLVKTVRTALDAKGLKSVHIGGSEAAQPGDPALLGSGTNLWADIANVPIDEAITHTYGGAGWDHYQFSLAPKRKWVTEWCDISGADEIHAAVQSAAHIARDLLNDGVSFWIYWNSYNYSDKPGSADLVYGTNSAAPLTTKLFHVLKRLFKEVPPDGTFHIHSFKSDDPDFETGLGSDFSKPVDAIAFKSPSKTVILLVNSTEKAKSVVVNGLSGAALHAYRTQSTTPSSAEMDDVGPVPVSGGSTAPFTMPELSVVILSDGPR